MAAVVGVMASLLPLLWVQSSPPSLASSGGEQEVVGIIVLALLQYVCLTRTAHVGYVRAALWLVAGLAELLIALSVIQLHLALPNLLSDLYARVGSPPAWLFEVAVGIVESLPTVVIAGAALALIFEDALGLVLWLLVWSVSSITFGVYVSIQFPSEASLGPNPMATVAMLDAISGLLYGLATGLVIACLTWRRDSRALTVAD